MKKHQIEIIQKSTGKIEGWFSNQAAYLIGSLDEIQQSLNIKGDIFEIGVHHGKSTVFFNHLINGSEKLNVCDIFDSQDQNISNSGNGDLEIFLKNIKENSTHELGQIHTCLSTNLSPKSIGISYRIFHIDGGHNASEALADLQLASLCIIQKGVIVVDDPFRHDWPGVTEAVIKFLSDNEEFTASIVGFNKLIILRKKIAHNYLGFIDDHSFREEFGLGFPCTYKKLPFMDSDLRIFYYSADIRDPSSLKIKAYKQIKKNKILKRIFKMLYK